MNQIRRLHVWMIGIEPLVARALRADLPAALVRVSRSLPCAVALPRTHIPDVVILTPRCLDETSELGALRRACGGQAVIVALTPRQPYARIWQQADTPVVVELGPGFLAPFLAAPTRIAHEEPD